MGWYHSHPFDVEVHSHCFLSSTDISTQLSWQRAEDPHGNPWLAIVVRALFHSRRRFFFVSRQRSATYRAKSAAYRLGGESVRSGDGCMCSPARWMISVKATRSLISASTW